MNYPFISYQVTLFVQSSALSFGSTSFGSLPSYSTSGFDFGLSGGGFGSNLGGLSLPSIGDFSSLSPHGSSSGQSGKPYIPPVSRVLEEGVNAFLPAGAKKYDKKIATAILKEPLSGPPPKLEPILTRPHPSRNAFDAIKQVASNPLQSAFTATIDDPSFSPLPFPTPKPSLREETEKLSKQVKEDLRNIERQFTTSQKQTKAIYESIDNVPKEFNSNKHTDIPENDRINSSPYEEDLRNEQKTKLLGNQNHVSHQNAHSGENLSPLFQSRKDISGSDLQSYNRPISSQSKNTQHTHSFPSHGDPAHPRHLLSHQNKEDSASKSSIISSKIIPNHVSSASSTHYDRDGSDTFSKPKLVDDIFMNPASQKPQLQPTVSQENQHRENIEPLSALAQPIFPKTRRPGSPSIFEHKPVVDSEHYSQDFSKDISKYSKDQENFHFKPTQKSVKLDTNYAPGHLSQSSDDTYAINSEVNPFSSSKSTREVSNLSLISPNPPHVGEDVKPVLDVSHTIKEGFKGVSSRNQRSEFFTIPVLTSIDHFKQKNSHEGLDIDTESS